MDQDTLNNLLGANTKLVDQLAQLVSTLSASTPSPKSTIQPPLPFKQGAADARRYVQYFTLWARSRGTTLNEKDAPKGKEWIAAFLSRLEGEAAIWATKYLDRIAKYWAKATADRKDADFPCGGDWNTFLNEFNVRFQAADDADQARRELDALSQGSRTVAEYAARFQEIHPRTDLSDTDLRVRFRGGLTQNAKTWLTLAEIVKEPANLDELITMASNIDYKMRGVGKDAGKAVAAPTAKDPYAMEVDASRPGPSGRTREDFLRQMRGRCLGCGSADHSKRDGGHGSSKCNYCGRLGHKEQVCQDRFLGRPKGGAERGRQRVAATSNFTLFPDDPPASTTAAPASPVPDMAAIHAAILKQNEVFQTLQSKLESASKGDF